MTDKAKAEEILRNHFHYESNASYKRLLLSVDKNQIIAAMLEFASLNQEEGKDNMAIEFAKWIDRQIVYEDNGKMYPSWEELLTQFKNEHYGE